MGFIFQQLSFIIFSSQFNGLQLENSPPHRVLDASKISPWSLLLMPLRFEGFTGDHQTSKGPKCKISRHRKSPQMVHLQSPAGLNSWSKPEAAFKPDLIRITSWTFCFYSMSLVSKGKFLFRTMGMPVYNVCSIYWRRFGKWLFFNDEGVVHSHKCVFFFNICSFVVSYIFGNLPHVKSFWENKKTLMEEIRQSIVTKCYHEMIWSNGRL